MNIKDNFKVGIRIDKVFFFYFIDLIKRLPGVIHFIIDIRNLKIS